MTRITLLLALLALAGCSLPQTPGHAPAASNYNPVSKTYNDD